MPNMYEQELDPNVDPSIFEATQAQNPNFTPDRMREIISRQTGATPPFLPPGEADLDAAIARERAKYFGTQQRYDATGSPRKMKWYEKLGTAMQMAAELGSGGTASGRKFEDVIRARAKEGIETGQRERIVKMQTDQKAEAAREANETKLEGIRQTALHNEGIRKLKALSDAGTISVKEAQAAKLEIDRQRALGNMNATTVEGAILAAKGLAQVDNLEAKTDVLNLRTSDQILNNTRDPDRWADAYRAMDAKARFKAAEKAATSTGPTSRTSTKEKLTDAVTGAEINRTSSTSSKGSSSGYVSPTIPGITPPTTLTTPGAPTTSPRLAAAASAAQTPLQTLSSKPAPFERASAANYDYPDFTPNPELFNRGGFVNSGIGAATRKSKEFINSSSLHTNSIISAMASGELDKFSGLAGTPMGDGIRRLFGDVSAQEGALRRLSINSIAKAESSDFGNRPMKILIDAERSGMPQPWYKDANMVASGVGRHYMLVLSAWAAQGNPQQKKLAEEIMNNPARLHSLSDSMQYYALSAIDAAKGRRVQPLPMPTNLYMLSRTDEELKKMYPNLNKMSSDQQKKAIGVIRATGGKTEAFTAPTARNSPIPKPPSVLDQAKQAAKQTVRQLEEALLK